MNHLPAPFGVIVQVFDDWRDDLVNMSLVTVVWALCWLTVVLGPPASLGLYYVTNRLAHGESTGLGGFIDGSRRYFLKSWLLVLLNLVATLILGVSFFFYGQFDAIWTILAQVLIFAMGLVWLGTQFYVPPYLIEQDDQQLRLALRNGLLTTLASPAYTLCVLGIAILLVVVSLVLVFPLVIGGPALAFLLSNRALLERLETFGVRD